MKKFMKGAAITGGILLLVGIIVIFIGVTFGGAKDLSEKSIDDIASLSKMSKLTEMVDKVDGINFLDGITISFGGTNFNANVFDDGQEIYSDGTYTFEDMNASNLEIVVGAGGLQVKYHDDEAVKMEVGSKDRMQCFVKGDTLIIRGGAREQINGGGDMVLYLPKNAVYNDVLIDVGAGNFSADALSGENITVEAGMGNVVINGADVWNVDVSVGMGNVEIEGEIKGDGIIDCGMGQVTMNLVGNGKDFNYELDCGMGSLDVEDVCSIAGIGDQSVDNKASKRIEVSVGMGSVEVEFEE